MSANPIELKRCPFCGGEGVLFDLEHDVAGTYWKVSCNAKADECPADACSVDKPTRDEAIAAWNRRAPEGGK